MDLFVIVSILAIAKNGGSPMQLNKIGSSSHYLLQATDQKEYAWIPPI